MNESLNWPAPDPIQAGVTQSSWTAADIGQEQLASFGQRATGRIFDVLTVYVVLLVIAMIFFRRTLTETDLENNNYTLIVSVLALVIQSFWEGKGGTPFRRRYGAVIVDMNTGQPIGMPRAFLRILVANFSLLAFGLGYFWMLWDPKKQTWHDKAARTLVVKR
jgi:uncharacterized RDD family membrane protein YckC